MIKSYSVLENPPKIDFRYFSSIDDQQVMFQSSEEMKVKDEICSVGEILMGLIMGSEDL